MNTNAIHLHPALLTVIIGCLVRQALRSVKNRFGMDRMIRVLNTLDCYPFSVLIDEHGIIWVYQPDEFYTEDE